MKTVYLSLCVLAAGLSVTNAQKASRPPNPAPRPKSPPPPVFQAPAAGKTTEKAFVYEQEPVTSRPYLVTPDQARSIIERFKEAYLEMNKPRYLIYVNRELVDQDSGLKLSARREERTTTHTRVEGQPPAADEQKTSESANGNSFKERDRVTVNNTYRVREKAKASIAERNRVRDVERLFGRPLRMAGAAIADQRVATQLISDRPLEPFTVPTETEQTRKDREALSNIAEVVIEVLVSSRDVAVETVSGRKTYSVPHIQATAVRLSDAQIVGQATSSDVLGSGVDAGYATRNFDLGDITEATALSLMEDMLLDKSNSN